VQLQGGKCEQCGVDFAKYAAMLVFQAKNEAVSERTKTQERNGVIKQLILLPITGGFSLIKYFRDRVKAGLLSAVPHV
jgi:hypothetical protein